MGRSIGVLATGHLWAGIVEDAVLGTVKMYPDPGEPQIDLKTIPAGEIITILRDQILGLAKEGPIESVGAGFPGMIRGGVILESPNLGQLKGLHLADELRAALKAEGIDVPVVAINNADALAAGIAATHESMNQLVRVWHLGDGIGYGRHPHNDGVWEAGHMVVTLDPKERYCGCGSWIWSRRRSSWRRGTAISGRASSSSCGIGRWPPAPRTASTWMVRGASIWRVRTPISWICGCSTGTCRRW